MEVVHLPENLLLEANEPSLFHLIDHSEETEDLVSVFFALRQAVLAKEHGVDAPHGIRIMLNIADVYILRQLETEPTTPSEHRFKTLFSAAHVFLYVNLRQVPRNGPLVRILVGRLRDALERTDFNVSAWAAYLGDLLWVLFVGAVVTEGRGDDDDDGWFLPRLKTVLRMLRCEKERDRGDQVTAFCLG